MKLWCSKLQFLIVLTVAGFIPGLIAASARRDLSGALRDDQAEAHSPFQCGPITREAVAAPLRKPAKGFHAVASGKRPAVLSFARTGRGRSHTRKGKRKFVCCGRSSFFMSVFALTTGTFSCIRRPMSGANNSGGGMLLRYSFNLIRTHRNNTKNSKSAPTGAG